MLSTSVTNAHSGGTDAFILRVDDQGATASVNRVTYVGTSSTDRGFGLAIDTSTNDVYVSGSTAGQFVGETQEAATDGFIAKVDSAGAIDFTHQFGGSFEHFGNAIAFDADGTDVLSRLSLGNGETPDDSAETVIAVTTVRPDQFFAISVNGGAAEKVTIEDDDSLGFLVFRINQILGTKGRASIEDDLGVKKLQIKASTATRSKSSPARMASMPSAASGSRRPGCSASRPTRTTSRARRSPPSRLASSMA